MSHCGPSIRSQCGRGRSHKSPYGLCSHFSRSAFGLLSVCARTARTARTVVAVRSPSALHGRAATVLGLRYIAATSGANNQNQTVNDGVAHSNM